MRLGVGCLRPHHPFHWCQPPRANRSRSTAEDLANPRIRWTTTLRTGRPRAAAGACQPLVLTNLPRLARVQPAAPQRRGDHQAARRSAHALVEQPSRARRGPRDGRDRDRPPGADFPVHLWAPGRDLAAVDVYLRGGALPCLAVLQRDLRRRAPRELLLLRAFFPNNPSYFSINLRRLLSRLADVS